MNEDTIDAAAGGGDELRARAERAEAALVALESEMRAKLTQAALATEAVRAGMIDLDGLKLIVGEVVDPAAAIDGLKAAKPWLFGGRSSASTAPVPRPEIPRPKSARDMSVEEWRAARAALLHRG